MRYRITPWAEPVPVARYLRTQSRFAQLDEAEIAAIQADDNFHDTFVKAAHNSEIQHTLERLMPKVRRLEIAQFGSLAGRSSVQQHQAIIAACQQKQSKQAADLIEQNWLSLGQQIVQSLDNQSQ